MEQQSDDEYDLLLSLLQTKGVATPGGMSSSASISSSYCDNSNVAMSLEAGETTERLIDPLPLCFENHREFEDASPVDQDVLDLTEHIKQAQDSMQAGIISLFRQQKRSWLQESIVARDEIKSTHTSHLRQMQQQEESLKDRVADLQFAHLSNR